MLAFCDIIDFQVIIPHVHKNGRYIVLNVVVNNNPVMLVNYYAPNVESEQLKLLNELNHIFNSSEIAENIMFIWGGDFNKIFDATLHGDQSFF